MILGICYCWFILIEDPAIIHVTEREFRRYSSADDLIPHKYYHGFAFCLMRDDDSGLFVPNIETAVGCLRNREHWLRPFNVKDDKLDLDKILAVKGMNGEGH